MLEVLLVDDEPFILQGLQLLVDWEKEGCHISTASNGKEALDYVESNPVDLIISDIKMPVMSGVDLLKNLRTQLNQDTYFVIVSGYAEFGYAQEALRYDCTDYILKPVEQEQLVGIINKVSALNQAKTSRTQDGIKRKRHIWSVSLCVFSVENMI
ncbi:Response regulator containing CheY-like receiver domain and AraC-type DNA-binding domain [Butyrivibrio fibrisolvens 16/4]|nr:Response regulator containing CheY-like receiver domain and AraC-type DNA-binding domain [Butyrivibrio fibrisolvens 16/4]